MKAKQQRNREHRKSYKKIELKKLALKFVFTNLLNRSNISPEKRSNILFLLMSKKNQIHLKSKSRLNRPCLLTNKTRGTFRHFGLSRSVLREYMAMGIIPGYKKAVW